MNSVVIMTRSLPQPVTIEFSLQGHNMHTKPISLKSQHKQQSQKMEGVNDVHSDSSPVVSLSQSLVVDQNHQPEKRRSKASHRRRSPQRPFGRPPP